MNKERIIEARGYKPTARGGLTAVGADNGCGGVSVVLFRQERGQNMVQLLAENGLLATLRPSGSPRAFVVTV